MAKKDYVKNAKAGDVLNKAATNDFIDQSETHKSVLVKFDKNTNEYEIKINGKIASMKYSKSFEDKVLEFMSNIDSRLDNVEKRLDSIEERLDVIESLPTIQKEMPNNKRKK